MMESPVTGSGNTAHPWVQKVRAEVAKAVIGQDRVVERLLVALLANGHVLLEGMPGLAKTLLVKSLGTVLGLACDRIQFTPDLLPSDVVGTMIFQAKDGQFSPHLGPIFANLVLADEINRAPSKVQSALLEAMQERQVTIGGMSHPLPVPFFVMATQNPIEHEGTYPLPEAQRDRFLFNVRLDYPSESEERTMVYRWGSISEQPQLGAVSNAAELLALRKEVDAVHFAPALDLYMLRLVRATRELVLPSSEQRATRRPAAARSSFAYGASPRGSLGLYQAGKALAWVRGRDFVTPEILQDIFLDVMRHRVGLTYDAEAEGTTAEQILRGVLDRTPVPTKAEASAG